MKIMSNLAIAVIFMAAAAASSSQVSELVIQANTNFPAVAFSPNWLMKQWTALDPSATYQTATARDQAGYTPEMGGTMHASMGQVDFR